MIKKKLIATAVSLTLLGTLTISIDSFARGGRGEGPPRAQEERINLLEQLDTNGDGVLTRAEFIARNADGAERRFDYKDVNDDGVLSIEEFSAPRGPRRHADESERLDTDALTQCMEEVLGYELPEPPNAETAFALGDVNLDNLVDLEEFLLTEDLRADERFGEIDADGDGQLTSDEIDAFQLVKQEQRDARRTCEAEQLDLEVILN